MGHIYILSNEAMPGLLKVGFTERTPQERAQELFTTSTPAPFLIEFAVQLSGNTYQIEQGIHRRLTLYRLDQRREFFRMDLEEAIKQIASFIIEEKYPLINLQGNYLSPFDKNHEYYCQWNELVILIKDKNYMLAETARLARLREKYSMWREDHSKITGNDIVTSVTISYFFGWYPALFAGNFFDLRSDTRMGLSYFAISFLSTFLISLIFQINKKIKSKWGTIAPDEYKEVAEQ